MHIEIRVGGAVRRGHVRLARRLEDVPATVSLVPVPSAVDGAQYRLMALERILHRLADDAHLPARGDGGRTGAHPATTHERPDDAVVVDLTADPGVGWRVAFDGRAGEPALLEALGRGRLPLVEVRDRDGDVVVAGRPGSEQPGTAAVAYGDVLAGLATLLLAALSGGGLAAPAADPAAARDAAAPGAGGRAARPPAVAAVRKTVGAVARHGYRALYRAPHWRVGWHFVDPGEPDVLDTLAHPRTGWHDLPDDGHHFYADPFPFVHADRTWLFVEDFDHRVGRGVVSAVEFDDDGPIGTPRPVLRHDVHLSYPFVLEDRGEVWMVPESSGAGTVELYRARSFPDRWERETVLLDGLEASDATLFEHGGVWWMLATVRHGGSFSDTLHAWSAERLTGPWEPHPGNPLLVDIASARPAGRVVDRDGRLLRPVQDNRTGYGASLLLTEITRLDHDGFRQDVLSELGPGPGWPGRRLHTLNRAGRLEAVDGSAMSPRLRRRPRPARG
jgi:hypothetical protein